MVERRHPKHTVMRSDIVIAGPVRLMRHRVPADGVDPYDLDFDQHDNANYQRVDAYALTWGRLRIEWATRPPA